MAARMDIFGERNQDRVLYPDGRQGGTIRTLRQFARLTPDKLLAKSALATTRVATRRRKKQEREINRSLRRGKK